MSVIDGTKEKSFDAISFDQESEEDEVKGLVDDSDSDEEDIEGLADDFDSDEEYIKCLADDFDTIVLFSNDGKRFEVRKKAALRSKLVETILEGDTTATEIPLMSSRVTGDSLALIVEHMEHHFGKSEIKFTKPIPSVFMEKMVEDLWDAAFVNGRTMNELVYMSAATSYMDYDYLTELCLCKLATLIKNGSTEQIKEVLVEKNGDKILWPFESTVKEEMEEEAYDRKYDSTLTRRILSLSAHGTAAIGQPLPCLKRERNRVTVTFVVVNGNVGVGAVPLGFDDFDSHFSSVLPKFADRVAGVWMNGLVIEGSDSRRIGTTLFATGDQCTAVYDLSRMLLTVQNVTRAVDDNFTAVAIDLSSVGRCGDFFHVAFARTKAPARVVVLNCDWDDATLIGVDDVPDSGEPVIDESKPSHSAAESQRTEKDTKEGTTEMQFTTLQCVCSLLFLAFAVCTWYILNR